LEKLIPSRVGQRQKENTTLTLQATCTIDNLDAFVADGNHAGKLDASVQFTPWGGQSLAIKES